MNRACVDPHQCSDGEDQVCKEAFDHVLQCWSLFVGKYDNPALKRKRTDELKERIIQGMHIHCGVSVTLSACLSAQFC